MKILNYLPKVLLLLTVLLTISSCRPLDPDQEVPELYLMDETGYVYQDTMLKVGEEFTCGVTAYGSKLTNFFIKSISNGQEQVVFDTGFNSANFSWSRSFIKSLEKEERWVFTIRDKEGYSASSSFNILLDTAANYQPVTEITAIKMGAQNNNATGSFFSIQDNSIHFLSELDTDPDLQALIDMVYYYYGEDKNVLASPGANIEDGIFTGNFETWTNINTTRYIKTDLSPADYNTIVNDSTLLANYTEGEGKRKAKKLKVNDIYTFKTKDNKLGIFNIKEVEGTEAGFVVLDVKIQK